MTVAAQQSDRAGSDGLWPEPIQEQLLRRGRTISGHETPTIRVQRDRLEPRRVDPRARNGDTAIAETAVQQSVAAESGDEGVQLAADLGTSSDHKPPVGLH